MPAGGSRVFTIRNISDLNAAILEIQARHSRLEDITVCAHMGVCPMGLFDSFSLEAWHLYKALRGGAPWPWLGGYYGQPAVFAQAQSIIELEQVRIEKESRILNHGGQ